MAKEGVASEPVFLASMPKGRFSEIRVAAVTFMGEDNIDVRVWEEPKGAPGPYAPKKQGFQFSRGKLPALIEALQRAQEAISGTNKRRKA